MPIQNITGEESIDAMIKMTVDKRSEWVRKQLEARGETEENQDERAPVVIHYPGRVIRFKRPPKPGQEPTDVRLTKALQRCVDGIADEVGCKGKLIISDAGAIRMEFS